MSSQAEARFVMITGLAGSGKSTALRALEDMGFLAVDNLPVRLLPSFVELPRGHISGPFKAALVMDLRWPDFRDEFPPLYSRLIEDGHNVELVFLEAADEVLVRRFSQTRRRHPLAADGNAVAADIRRERRLLLPMREMANHVLDTSRLNVHQLRRELMNLFSRAAPPASLQINLMSFGFKYGVPGEADLVMDVRFLPNPYFTEELRELDGLDQRVVDYVFKHGDTQEFLKRFKGLLDFLAPMYLKEGKSRLTIAVGCTGGKHRSVAITCWLAENFSPPHSRLSVRHRDIELE